MTHTALVNSGDKEGELLPSDVDVLWGDELWLDGNAWVSAMSSLSTTNSFYDTKQKAGTKVGPDQLGPPVRVGSTRIVSDHEKKNIKLKKTESFSHLKAKIPVNNGPN